MPPEGRRVWPNPLRCPTIAGSHPGEHTSPGEESETSPTTPGGWFTRDRSNNPMQGMLVLVSVGNSSIGGLGGRGRKK